MLCLLGFVVKSVCYCMNLRNSHCPHFLAYFCGTLHWWLVIFPCVFHLLYTARKYFVAYSVYTQHSYSTFLLNLMFIVQIANNVEMAWIQRQRRSHPVFLGLNYSMETTVKTHYNKKWLGKTKEMYRCHSPHLSISWANRTDESYQIMSYNKSALVNSLNFSCLIFQSN